MRQLGLTAAATREARVDAAIMGERYSAEQARSLPVGTVLAWHSNTGEEWAYYLRTRDMEPENVAGTRMICGRSSSARNYRSSMRVVALSPEEDDEAVLAVIPFTDTFFIDSFPVGSVFNTQQDSGPYYVIARDGLAATWDHGRRGVPATGTWRGEQFGSYVNFYYYGMG
jgi:hypothetical protein